MLVVVVLPWVPATAMPYFMRISSASISARGMTGIIRRPASATSGLPARMAVEVTTTSASPTFSAPMPENDLPAQVGQAPGDVRLAQIGAGNLVAEVEQDLGNAAHADAADADEVNFPYSAVHRVQSPFNACSLRSPEAQRRGERFLFCCLNLGKILLLFLRLCASALNAFSPGDRPAFPQDQVGRPAPAQSMGGAGHDQQPLPVVKQITGQPRQRLGGQLRLRQHQRRAAPRHGAGIGRLVIAGGMRIGHHDRRPAAGGQFGDGSRPGAAQNQVRVGIGAGHVVE